MRLRYEIKTRLFVGEDRCLDPVSKPGDRPSKIGPSIDKPGAAPDVSIEIGGQLTRSIDIFYFPYHPYLLVVRSIDTPGFSVGRKGEGVTGATPLFCASCGARHPFQLTLRVSVAALPGGGRSRLNNPCGKARIPEADRA